MSTPGYQAKYRRRRKLEEAGNEGRALNQPLVLAVLDGVSRRLRRRGAEGAIEHRGPAGADGRAVAQSTLDVVRSQAVDRAPAQAPRPPERRTDPLGPRDG